MSFASSSNRPPLVFILAIIAMISGTAIYAVMQYSGLLQPETPEWVKAETSTQTLPKGPSDEELQHFSTKAIPVMNSYEHHATLIYDLIAVQRYREAEAALQKLEDPSLKTRDGLPYLSEVLRQMTDGKQAKYTNSIPVFEYWVKTEPDNMHALLLRGIRYYQMAWEIRGWSWASDVAPNAWEKYFALLNKAGQDLTIVYQSGTLRLPALEYLMAVTTSMGMPGSTHSALFMEALREAPDYYPFHREHFRYLSPYWQGSWKAAMAYSWQIAERLGGETLALVPEVLELYSRHHEQNPALFLNDDEVWPTIATSYQTLFTLYPNNTRWLAGLAEIALKAERLELAKHLIERALAIYPEDQKALLAAASYYVKTLQWEQAMTLYGKLAELLPHDPYILASAGWAHLWGGRYSSAASYYSKVQELYPADASYSVSLCHIYYLEGYYETAFNECSRAAELSPRLAPTYYFRAMVNDALGMTNRAAADRQIHTKLLNLEAK